MTTLDSATRLLRFNVEEIFRSLKLEPLANRYLASLVAVAGIAAFGLLPAGKTLWVMFGTTNQLLAGLTLLTVSLFLFKLGRPIWYTLLPMALMITMAVWAMIWSLIDFIRNGSSPLLVGVTVLVLAMALWLMVEAALSFARGRGHLQLDLPEPPAVDHQREQVADSAHVG